MSGSFDLHTHSNFSDGTTTPSENAALAAAEGLAGFALTDHDTIAGWEEAAAAASAHGVRFVPGLELSTELGGLGVHILGYGVDPTDAALLAECERLRDERRLRAQAMVVRLGELGIDITMAAVESHAAGAPIGRPHVAAAMVAAGAVEDLDAAFEHYIADDGPAYVSKHALSPERGVELIVAAGGVAVLAHPGVGRRHAAVNVELLDRLVEAGLAGVEADHAAHDAAARAYWRGAARRRDLFVTGSSDFHGRRKEARIGEATTAAAVVDILRGHAREKETLWW